MPYLEWRFGVSFVFGLSWGDIIERIKFEFKHALGRSASVYDNAFRFENLGPRGTYYSYLRKYENDYYMMRYHLFDSDIRVPGTFLEKAYLYAVCKFDKKIKETFGPEDMGNGTLTPGVQKKFRDGFGVWSSTDYE